MYRKAHSIRKPSSALYMVSIAGCALAVCRSKMSVTHVSTNVAPNAASGASYTMSGT